MSDGEETGKFATIYDTVSAQRFKTITRRRVISFFLIAVLLLAGDSIYLHRKATQFGKVDKSGDVWRNPQAYVIGGPDFGDGIERIDWDWSKYKSTNLYLLHFDGERLSIKRNYSDINGMGLGVHTCLNPTDAKSFTASDGQKDINAWMDVDTGRVKAAFRYDWVGNDCSLLKTCWSNGGKIRIVKLALDPVTGKYNYTGTRGNKIDFELVPMAEGDIEDGKVAGSNKEGLTAADGWVWHPSGR
ncbi:hypothetical protein HK104_002866 [Borealophlyctis nickersoniae]|nr:hypothetical protein HK104_002866 [Borealophlyctis nickersoniae]